MLWTLDLRKSIHYLNTISFPWQLRSQKPPLPNYISFPIRPSTDLKQMDIEPLEHVRGQHLTLIGPKTPQVNVSKQFLLQCPACQLVDLLWFSFRQRTPTVDILLWDHTKLLSSPLFSPFVVSCLSIISLFAVRWTHSQNRPPHQKQPRLVTVNSWTTKLMANQGEQQYFAQLFAIADQGT